MADLHGGTLPDSRVTFYSTLINDALLVPIAKARAVLFIAAAALNDQRDLLGEQQSLSGVMSGEETELVQTVVAQAREAVRNQALTGMERGVILGIAAENLEFDWPNGNGVWRRNLSSSNNLGQFFTPHEVMSLILRRCLDGLGEVPERPMIVDPFGGVGTFVVLAQRALKQRAAEWAESKPAYVVAERNPIFAALAADLLAQATDGISEYCVFGGDSLVLDTRVVSASEKLKGSSLAGMLGHADLLVTNPPYSRMKFHRDEFAAKESYLGDVQESALAEYLADKKAEIAEYKKRLRGFRELSPAMQGEWDLYRLGTMRAVSLLSDRGVMGIITPSSILGDWRSSRLRRFLLEAYSITDVLMIGERAKLFRTVNQPTAVYVVKRSERPHVTVRGQVDSWDQLSRPMSAHEISSAEILQNVGEPYPIPVCSGRLLDLYRHLIHQTALRDIVLGGTRRGELDLTACRDCLTTNARATALARGDNIERYVQRSAAQHRKTSRVAASRFLKQASANARGLILEDRLVGRQCSYMGKLRRMSWVVISGPCVVANSCNYIARSASTLALEALEVLLNSCLLDWFFRTTSTNNHVGNYEVDRCPIPDLAAQDVDRLVSLGERLKRAYASEPFGASGSGMSELEREVDEQVIALFDIDSRLSKELLLLYYR